MNLLQGAHQANIHSVLAELPKSAALAPDDAAESVRRGDLRGQPAQLPAGLEGRLGDGHDAAAAGAAERTRVPGLARRRGVPDLDLLLEGDNGIRVILDSHTSIKNGITTSNFFSIPDVPVSSFVLELPSGPNSALTAVGALCTQTLTMPTTVTAQSGAQS